MVATAALIQEIEEEEEERVEEEVVEEEGVEDEEEVLATTTTTTKITAAAAAMAVRRKGSMDVVAMLAALGKPTVPLRYLMVTGNNVQKAQEKWEATLKWRAAYGADTILETPHTHYHLIKKYFPQFMAGRSRSGNPVVRFEFYENTCSTMLGGEGGLGCACSCVSMPFFFHILNHTNLSLLPFFLPSQYYQMNAKIDARTLVSQGVDVDKMIWCQHYVLITKHNSKQPSLPPSLPP